MQIAGDVFDIVVSGVPFHGSFNPLSQRRSRIPARAGPGVADIQRAMLYAHRLVEIVMDTVRRALSDYVENRFRDPVEAHELVRLDIHHSAIMYMYRCAKHALQDIVNVGKPARLLAAAPDFKRVLPGERLGDQGNHGISFVLAWPVSRGKSCRSRVEAILTVIRTQGQLAHEFRPAILLVDVRSSALAERYHRFM